MNPAKRRRLDATSSTLRKPFRSPLKVSTDKPASPDPAIASKPDQQDLSQPPSPALSLAHDAIPKNLPPPSSPSSKRTSTATPSRSVDQTTILQKQYSALTQELRRLRQDLDVAEQARKLSSNSQGQQLEDLITKWRDVARAAAEEVFEITSTRIKDMGGIRAWQKSTQESSQSWYDEDSPRRHSHCSADGDGEEHSTSLIQADDPDALDDQQEQSFTMSMMLGQMNINLDLLSYDENNDLWAD